jgi:hypothetical protein
MRKMRCDSRNLRSRYLPLAGSEDETHGVCAEFGSKMCVIKIRVGAYLNPHG